MVRVFLQVSILFLVCSELRISNVPGIYTPNG
eukprot:UN06076